MLSNPGSPEPSLAKSIAHAAGDDSLVAEFKGGDDVASLVEKLRSKNSQDESTGKIISTYL